MTATRSNDAYRDQTGTSSEKPDPEEEPEFMASDLDTVEMELSSDDTVIMRASELKPKADESQSKASSSPDQECPAKHLMRVFQEAPYGDLDNLEVRCEGSTLRLCGRVPSFFLKQIAQEIARREIRALGGKELRSLRVVNAIEVRQSTSANGIPR